MTKKIKISYLGLVFLPLALFLFSQKSTGQTRQNEFWKHARFGGGIGLGFGDGYFSGTIAPSVIYQFNEKFAAGVGLNASYARMKGKGEYKSFIYGGSLIGLYNVIPEIQLSTEFEELHVTRSYDGLDTLNYTETFWYPALFIGMGFRSDNVTIGIRYDVLYNSERSIYANAFMPFVRVYF